jgi:hypothetical protein
VRQPKYPAIAAVAACSKASPVDRHQPAQRVQRRTSPMTASAR